MYIYNLDIYMYMYILMYDERKCILVNFCIFVLFCRIIRNCCGFIYVNLVCIVFIYYELIFLVKKWWEIFLLINLYKNYILTNYGIIDNLKILVFKNLSDFIIFIWGF